MSDNPLRQLQALGQSVWLDFISRTLLDTGELARLIERDGVSGLTSNPAIFAQAIESGGAYDADITALAASGKSAPQIYEALVRDDIRRAADCLLAVFNATGGRDGYASIEVSPHLAHDCGGTLTEARRLWGLVARPNVLIKVPATVAALPAIETLIAEGINVNVTLLFALDRYRAVARAYVAGLTRRADAGAGISGMASVASFFLSRIDTAVDALLPADSELRGEAAIASARLAYEAYGETFGGAQFAALAKRGARPQRLLWASTGTKNPAYSDVKYVEPLIGPDTVNTLPLETLNAYRNHGRPAPTLAGNFAEARSTLERLRQAGIDLDAITRRLEEDGVVKFMQPFDRLIAGIAKRCVAGAA